MVHFYMDILTIGLFFFVVAYHQICEHKFQSWFSQFTRDKKNMIFYFFFKFQLKRNKIEMEENAMVVISGFTAITHFKVCTHTCV